MEESLSVALKLANTIENLEIVRAVLAGVGEAFALDALERNDVETAVLEACKNVVWHAYEGVRGPLEVEVNPSAGLLEVAIRDHGIGIRPHLGERTLPHTGIGMPIAHLLSRRITYTNLPAGGTEVRMEFELPAVAAGVAEPGAATIASMEADGRGDSISLVLAGGPVAVSVFRRALAALLTRAGMAPVLSTEAATLAAAISAAAGGPGAHRLMLEARLLPGGLDLAFREPGATLKAALEDLALPGRGDGPLIIAQGEAGAEAGERLMLRLRASSG